MLMGNRFYTKKLTYAYPSSADAKTFGCSKTGCYIIESWTPLQAYHACVSALDILHVWDAIDAKVATDSFFGEGDSLRDTRRESMVV